MLSHLRWLSGLTRITLNLYSGFKKVSSSIKLAAAAQKLG
jgi:hypothetical protein